MLKAITIKANPYLLITHFIQMNNYYNQQKYLWGLKFNQAEFKRRYPMGIQSIDLMKSEINELFLLFQVKSSLNYRDYSPPDEFLIIGDTDKINFDEFYNVFTEMPKLYQAVSIGGNEYYVAVQFCNEINIVDLDTGLPLISEDGEVLCFAPVFWERGEVFIEFLSKDTFVARQNDRVNGSDNSLFRIENGKAILLDENFEN